MSSLTEVQRALHEMMRGERPVEEAADVLGCDPQRLVLYRNFVQHHIHSVLEKDYPIVHALLPEAVWDRLRRGYYHRYPASSWELNIAAVHFPDFLESERAAGEAAIAPFHVDLARLEWEQFAAFVNTEPMPDRAQLEGPVLNPTLSIIQTDHPVVAFAAAWDRGERPEVPAPIDPPQTVVVYRSPEGNRTRYRVADDDLLFAIKVVHDGLDPADAAEAIGQPAALGEAALAGAAEAGVVLRPAS